MNILHVEKLTRCFGKGDQKIKAVDDITFSIEKGSFVSIVGQSGSGKSTLLNLIGGLDKPTSGKIILQDQELSKLSQKQLTIFRRRNVGFIFQNYSLMTELSVYDNIALPLTLDFRKKIDHAFIEEILKSLGIWDKRYQNPSQLSGGQQQRVAIGRALANKPALILADEPTGNLDSKTTFDVMGLLKQCNQDFGQTIMMVTHDDHLAQSCDEILHITDGKLKTRRELL